MLTEDTRMKPVANMMESRNKIEVDVVQ